MKKLFIIAIAIMFASSGNSQTRITAPKDLRDKSCKKTHAVFETTNKSLKTQDPIKNPDDYSAEVIGRTWYDLQSNSSVQNRTFLYPDGFIGGAFTFGENYAAFPDRGTGYNIFDNNDWGPWPVERIESDRCGWPSYAPWGPNGEIAVAHYSDGLVFSKRTTKGSGPWTEFYFMGPDGHSLLWPRMITGGTNHETIHLIALTTPVANGGAIYQGQDGALVYSRSTDGGVSWDIENVVIDGLGSEYYTGFEGDTYEFSHPRENTVALLIGNDWTDLIILKSTDNGDTWFKTLVWEHPYPLFDQNNMIVTDTFYCADGAHSVTIDNAGKAHVAFGINRALCDGTQQYWFPLVDGIGYWNEDMPTFSTNLNALSPYGEQGTELVEDYNLIGWMQDINGNGVLDILPDVALYYIGTSSMPQLVLDNQSQIFLVYSSVNETYDNGIQNYRHIWARGSNNNGISWGDFHDLNSDLIYIFDECVFPSCSPTSDENLHFTYQSDNEPGLAVRGDEDPFGENNIIYYTIEKSDIITPVIGNSLTGIVSELEGGAPIQGATISIEGTAYSAISYTGGTYTINGIPAGSYIANCSKEGYLDESIGIVIYNNNTTYQNFELAQVVIPDEEIIGNTFYDLQSNASMQNRIYKYDDGTIGAAWTFGINHPTFPGRGTGYNYFNGMEWGDFPLEKLESVRTGWPSYMPFGENGEMVASHDFSAGSLIFLNREEKGEGDWTEEEFFGPTGINISWNRTKTSGMNHNTIQLLSLTWPTNSNGSLYEGLDGALLYSRSTSGGQSWDQENVILDGMTSTDYFGFAADNFEWAENGNNIAFLVGSQWVDLFLMKSTDNGISWTKTVIWEHPYPLIDPTNTTPTDTFYCVDGAHSLYFDNSGKIHVAFGITRAYSDGSGANYIEEVDGIGYWNEDMTTFSNNLNALSPYGDPGSELIQDYNLIAWSQDLNENGELDFLNDWGEYYLGISSMPQLIIDEQGNRYLIYSSVTEGYDNGTQNYRHLWARGFNNYIQAWGDFIDLNSDIVFTMTECVFPSVSPTTDNSIHLLFMEDSEPGLAVRGDLDPYGENFIRYMNVSKAELIPQLELGTLSGTVTNYIGGSPISGATIHVLGTSLFANTNAYGTYEITDIPTGNYTVSCEKEGYVTETSNIDIEGNYTTSLNFQMEEPAPPVTGHIGDTWYDLQSNSSMQNRIHLYDDGTIGGVYTFGNTPTVFPERGTGYNYYDGSTWGPMATERLEDDRSGWPSYTPWGPDGEIVVAHYSGASTDGLIIGKRQNKGTGDWSFIDYYGPSANNYYLWPRAMCGGNNHNDLHVIALTAPVANGGLEYQGMDGALLYSRSPDGGQTWDYEHVLLDEINSDDFFGISGDTYEIQTQGNNVAFLVGDEWTDLVLMKSTDNGDSWTKTIIWEHPYPLSDPNGSTPTDTFYCVDGAHSLAFDQSGKIHITFGINRSINVGGTPSWFPLVDGIGYWNEDMPTFSNNLNALSPYGDPGTELITDYNLIGWSQDLNGNGELDILGEVGLYYVGLSSMPQLVIDEMNNIFLVYSSVTEGYDNGLQDYRHLWARGSNDNGQTWGGFFDLNEDLVYIFSECVFPSLSQTTDNSIHLIFMEDNEPGMAVRGDEDPFGNNNIVYMNVLKSSIVDPSVGGALEGMVTDGSSTLPIEGAIISLEGTTFSTTSGLDGSFAIYNIPPEEYEVVCTKMGYTNGIYTVEILGNITTTVDIYLYEGIGLDPPENLSATVFDQINVSLSWDAPLSGPPLGYNMYRNNTLIGFHETTFTNDYTLNPGNYTYFVTAVYEFEESLPSNSVDVIISEPLLPPINLEAEVNDNDVLLTWGPPGGPPDGQWIRWDEGMNFSAVGLDNSGTMYVASHWYPGDLIDYDGMTMTHISFFPYGDNSPTFELLVWTGEDAVNLILSQPLSSYVANQFNTVLLNTPITIDASSELWFGYAVTHELGSFPAGCDAGPALPYFGDMFSNDGTNWVSLSTANPTLDYNWNLAAYIEETDGEKIVNIPMQRKTTGLHEFNGVQTSGVFGSNNATKVFAPSTSKDLLYYNIYKDDNLIGNTTATFYNDMDLTPGEYEYCVSAVYDEGESDCSETVIAIITEPCYPPENVTATLFNITDLEVSWDPPSSGGPDGYIVYRNGIFIDFVFDTEIYFTDIPPGTYEFCVSTVCNEDESETNCADPVAILLLVPTNLEAEISGSNIILTWDTPENKGLIGYNVYHKFESGDFSLFAYVTQTSCIFADPFIGLHEFYVRAVYDQGESAPGNTVEVIITSVIDHSSGGITIHPNPATDYVNIKSGLTIESLIVYDYSGQIIGEEIVHEKFYRFNSSKLTSGVYFFRIKTSEGIVLKRIIIE